MPSHHPPALRALAYPLCEQFGLRRARLRHLTLRAEQLASADQAHRQLLLDVRFSPSRRGFPPTPSPPALIFLWSSGIVEGNVNRIKTIKRTMHGRASFRLLHTRSLLQD